MMTKKFAVLQHDYNCLYDLYIKALEKNVELQEDVDRLYNAMHKHIHVDKCRVKRKIKL